MKPVLLILLSLLLVSGGCSKHVTTLPPPALYGQWKWVELDWTFCANNGITYPGRDSTVILQLDSSASTYSIKVNGETTLTGSYTITIAIMNNILDSGLDISNPGNYSFAGEWLISGIQQLLIQNDTLSLTRIQGNPAGTASDFKFIGY